jgi:hypothetical protein
MIGGSIPPDDHGGVALIIMFRNKNSLQMGRERWTLSANRNIERMKTVVNIMRLGCGEVWSVNVPSGRNEAGQL